MAWWRRTVSVAKVALRVPPLFVVDELLKLSLGLTASATTTTTTTTTTINNNNQTHHYDDEDDVFDADNLRGFLFIASKFLLCCGVCLLALSMFVLRMKHLIVVYMYLASIGIVIMSYWSNTLAVKQVLSYSCQNDTDPPRLSQVLEDVVSFKLGPLFDLCGPAVHVFQNYFIQYVLATVFYAINLGPRHWALQYSLPLSFMLPLIIAALPFPDSVLQRSPMLATLLPLAIIKFVLWSSFIPIAQIVYDSYRVAKNFAQSFGLSALIETEWVRLNVPNVLRMFWILRVIEHAVVFLMDNYELSEETFRISTLLACQTTASMVKSLLISGCETITAVLGMTSIISFFCHCIGVFFQWVLLTDDEEDRNIGIISAILFYVLALQTGLTSLNPEKRFVRLCRNFCLLFAALMHFLHNIVNPVLMSLSASHNPSTHRHVRALCVCAFLIIFPIGLLCYLWSNHAVSTWLLAVSAFSIEVIVKVMVSLMIYSLFLIDAYRTTFWERLDDYVYYIRAFGNTVEFCFGIFLFFNGAWILVFESGGAIRALMMCIHAYFNIWCEARAGWSIFMKRRTAVNKIDSLPEATAEQLEALNDVCAICYQEMISAKITQCNHYFHGVCLRKWLYVQDRCPLCHDILYKIDKDKDSESESGSEGENLNENMEENAR